MMAATTAFEPSLPLLTPPLSSPPSVKSQGSPWHNENRSFLQADVALLVAQLTKSEKVKLLAGADWWHTVPIHRLNIPGVKMSDGPNGARGASFAEQTAGIAIPCETALAATFSPALVHSAASLLARETKDRGAVALLAPTVNIQRSPLGGRSFESFTEDPVLSGIMATAYIDGLQQNGVSAVLKHFVCNDQEHERTAVSSEVSQRALREIYLRPFMMAVKDAKPLAIMSSYNRVNGTHVSENKELIDDILRKQWLFDGMVMSDWFGVYSVDQSILAGVDIEMPGPAKWRTPYLIDHCLLSRKLVERDLDERVYKVLQWAQKLARMSPDVVYGDDVEESHDRVEDREMLRQIGAAACVLLKNEQSALPLVGVHRVAVIGPRATAKTVFGGGSAQLNTSYVVTVLDGVQEVASANTEVSYALGTPAHKMLPYLDNIIREDGEEGCDMRLVTSLDKSTPSVRHLSLATSFALISDDIPAILQNQKWFGVLTGTWMATTTGRFEFSVSVCGRARLYVDDQMVVDNWDIVQSPGDSFFGQGTLEETGVINVVQGRTYRIKCTYSNVQGIMKGATNNEPQPIHNFGVRIGGFPVVNDDDAMDEAVKLASQVDAVILAVGLSPDFESESYDRSTLALPMRTNELVERVAAANPRTIVAIQSGSAVSMPWAAKVPAIVQAWYGGNSAGLALADVLFGRVNPSGRLPLTFPIREEDIAAHGHFCSSQGKVLYAEDLAVGYKWFLDRKIVPLFPFGHGMSYSTFEYSDLSVSRNDLDLKFTFVITNSGSVAGSHSAQLYLSPPKTSLPHPIRHLGGIAFANDIAPGDHRKVSIEIARRELAHWDDDTQCWSVETGAWRAFLSASSVAPEQCVHHFSVDEKHEWHGL